MLTACSLLSLLAPVCVAISTPPALPDDGRVVLARHVVEMVGAGWARLPDVFEAVQLSLDRAGEAVPR